MKNNLITIMLLLSSGLFAQPLPRQSIEDSVFGWYKVYHLKGAKEIKKMDTRVYSIAQPSICDTLVNWIKASYVPKAASGMMLKKC